MELRRFDDPAAFLDHTRAYLLMREAEHNLILGLCMRLVAGGAGGGPPYLAAVSERGAVVAAALMTPLHNLVLSLAPPAALALIAADIQACGVSPPGVTGEVAISRAFAERWQALSGQPFRLVRAMRIYQLTAVIPVTGVPGEFRRATEADRDLLVAWTRAFDGEALGEEHDAQAARVVDARLHDPSSALSLWCDRQPVSMAGRTGPTPHGIRVNAVYTPPALRGRGYARACVAALSQHLLDSGHRFCFLFTDLSNPTANRIYQAIGYQPVCDVRDYAFLPAAGS